MIKLKLLLSVLLWIPKVLFLLVINVITVVFSPIICLFVKMAEEKSVTGFPSLFPGKPRAFLIKPLFWFQSFDAPLDEFWYGDYTGWPKTGKTQADYDSSWLLRYFCYINWLCRNPAYGFGQALGYDSTGMKYIIENDNRALWRRRTNISYWLCTNAKGQIGWWFKAQFFFTSKRWLEVNLGYKLDSDTIINKRVVAMQFTPFLSIK